MPEENLDEKITAFIFSFINSVELLEILILLRLKGELDVETIDRELRTSTTSVEKRLADLLRKGLVGVREQTSKTTYFYTPTEKYEETIHRLIQLYSSHRVSVINAIFSKPKESMLDFSDAFRIRDK